MTNEELRSLIPNVFKEVKGEDLLVDKLKPWLDSAAGWLTNNIIGHGYELPESALALAKKIIVSKAFAEAVPSLDLSLTPAGFSVINTDGRAPASKDRVDRLIGSLISSVEANLLPFIHILLSTEEWRSTVMGKYWLGTFMSGLDDAMDNKRDKDLLTTYRTMRDSANRFESELTQNYLGKAFMAKIRPANYETDASSDAKNIWWMIHRAELRFITSHSSDQNSRCPDEHEVWHLAEPILREIQYCHELREIWEDEMGESFKVEPFKNTRHGGFFF